MRCIEERAQRRIFASVLVQRIFSPRVSCCCVLHCAPLISPTRHEVSSPRGPKGKELAEAHNCWPLARLCHDLETETRTDLPLACSHNLAESARTPQLQRHVYGRDAAAPFEFDSLIRTSFLGLRPDSVAANRIPRRHQPLRRKRSERRCFQSPSWTQTRPLETRRKRTASLLWSRSPRRRTRRAARSQILRSSGFRLEGHKRRNERSVSEERAMRV